MAIFTVKPHENEEVDYDPALHGSFIENVNLIAHRIRIVENDLYQDIEEIVNVAFLWATMPFPGEPDSINAPGKHSSYAYSVLSKASADSAKIYADQLNTLFPTAHGLPANTAPTVTYDSSTGEMAFGIPTGVGPEGPQGLQGPKGDGIDVLGTKTYTEIIAIDPSTLDVGDIFIVSVDHLPEASAGDGMVFDGIQFGGADDWTNFGPLRGPEGIQGPQGTVGQDGSDGADGNDGADSTVPGPQGIQGITGATGAAGPQGPQGLAGLNGNNGIDGTDGTNGIDGDGWNSVVYNPSNGTITFDADNPALDYTTGDLRGAQGIQGIQGPVGPTVPVIANLASTSDVDALAASQGKILDEKKIDSDTGTIAGSSPVNNMVFMTQAAYTALGTYDNNTMYVIKG